MSDLANIAAETEPKHGILRQWELVDLVRAYDPSVDEALLNKAYVFSVQAHGTQMRHSGDPYYAHPIEVAGILASLHLDTASICTALLHDVLEDTDTTYDEMVEMFGSEIAELVKGVTKLSQLELKQDNSTKEQAQAENFQKFVLAMSKDVRVLLVKLCDRLHNMRTLEFHPKEASRKRIAKETLEIYAPLARRVGVDKICSELEDWSFKHLNPSAYESITRRLKDWRIDRSSVISQASLSIKETLKDNDITARVFGREKRAYSIWRKLQRQGISFEDVADIYAFRILVKEVGECYNILGILHQKYRCVPARFRDFISVPKSNGYQSLHTTILGPNNKRIEIQIRTEAMNDVAEHGVAAHWNYKDQSYSFDEEEAAKSGGDPLGRIRPLLEILEHGGDADEFLEHAKLEMFADQVFTFTPKSTLISLPRGATPIDFAYAVHTDVGNTCIGAIVNGRECPLRTRLQNGDVVKIIRGGTAEPQPGWENMVVTGRARSALRKLTRAGEQDEFRKIGQQLVTHAFAREDRDFSVDLLDDALKRLAFVNVDALYETLGRGKLSVNDFMNAVFPARKTLERLDPFANRDLIDDNSARLYIKGEGMTEGVGLHLGECCSPIPGDRIVGYVSEGQGIVIHTIDCETLAGLEDNGHEWLDLGWRRAVGQSASTGRISATVEHVPGALAELTQIIGEAGGNLTNIRTLKRSPTFFDMIFDIEVVDVKHLVNIIAAMRASAYVVAADRNRADSAPI